MSKNENTKGGIGLIEILTIIFVIAKILRLIDWSWWWVFSPCWLTVLVCVVAAILANISNRRV